MRACGSSQTSDMIGTCCMPARLVKSHPNSQLLTGIRRTPCATPPAGMQLGHLAESCPHTGLGAHVLHRRQQWAHADQLHLEEKQLQHREWPYHHSRSLRELRRFSSESGSRHARTSKCGTPMAHRRLVVQHWATSARWRVKCKCWRDFVESKKRSRFGKCAKPVWEAKFTCLPGAESWIGCSRRMRRSVDDYLRLKQTWASEVGNKAFLVLLFMRPIENSNLKDWNCTRRTNGQIRLQEKRSICAENWKWETDSSKKVAQEIANKLRNFEESVAKKQIEPDNWELMNCLCYRRGIQSTES